MKEKLDEMQMSVKEFALLTAMSEKNIKAVMSGTASVTLELAEAFEQVTRIPAHFWLNLQRNYDESVVRRRSEVENPAEEKYLDRLEIPVLP